MIVKLDIIFRLLHQTHTDILDSNQKIVGNIQTRVIYQVTVGASTKYSQLEEGRPTVKIVDICCWKYSDTSELPGYCRNIYTKSILSWRKGSLLSELSEDVVENIQTRVNYQVTVEASTKYSQLEEVQSTVGIYVVTVPSRF